MSPTYSICADHGYITGEHFNCPICGRDAEVYSRITGYYRPVRNWNDGKSQEFRDRLEYNIKDAIAYEPAVEAESIKAASTPVATYTVAEDTLYLFTTATCPNCKIAKAILDREGVEYSAILAEENAELAAEFGIRQAPTLVVVNGENVQKYAGVANVKRYLAGEEAK